MITTGCQRHSVRGFLSETAIQPQCTCCSRELISPSLPYGSVSSTTTHIYVEADMAMKKRAIEKITMPVQKRRAYKPSNRLMAFVESL